MEEDLRAAHLRLARVNIENLSRDKIIDKYDRDKTLFYLDPSYWETTGYNEIFEFSQYEHIAKLAQMIKGKMVISINDHPEIRQAFEGLRVKKSQLTYTVGGSERSTKNTGELIYFNW